MFLKFFFILISLISILFANSNFKHSVVAKPLIQNYGYMDYKGHNQVWGATQSPKGLLYFVNSNIGILEYNGNSWKSIKLTNSSSGRSIDIDKNGLIYVGGVGDFGYLKDENGEKKFISLVPFIPKKYQNFEYVWECVATDDGVYFGTDNIIYRWHKNKIEIIESKNGFHITREFNNRAYTREIGKGLMRIDKNRLTLVKDGEKFANSSVNALIEYDANTILVASREQGLFLYNGLEFKEFKTDADEFLLKNKIYDAKALSENEFIIATKNGAVIIDKRGSIKHFLDKNQGIRDNFITHIFVDNQKNLWLSLENGISKVEYPSPFSIYDSLSGINSSINSITKYNNILYISTMNGLYREKYISKDRNRVFEKIDKIDVNAWKMIATDSSLLVGTSKGVYEVQDSKAKLLNIVNDTIMDMVISKDKTKIYLSTSKGLEVIELVGKKWINRGKIEKIDTQPWNLAIDNRGNIWGSSETGVIFKVDSDLNIEKFGKDENLKGSNFFISFINGRVFVSTSKGVFYFDEKLKKFQIDTDFKNFKEVSKVIEGIGGDIWIRHSNPQQLTLAKRENQKYRFIDLPFKRIYGYRFEDIYTDRDNISYFGGAEGLVRYDSKIDIDVKPYYTLIDKIIFNNQILKRDSRKKREIFEYSKNSIKFHFSATYFTEESKLLYQVYLEGFDEKYSDWSRVTQIDYTNLKEGDYTLYVRSKNIYDVISKEDSFSFKILAPWYRSWWAYFAYISSTLFFIYIVVLFQVRRSERKTKEELRREQKYSKLLEERVNERTKDLNKTNTNLQKLSNQLSKYLSPQLYNSIFTGKQEVKLDAKRKKLSIFFSDIKDFTKMTEHMEPEDLTNLLNNYLNEMSSIAIKHGATIDKFIGDAIVIFFGDPDSNGVKEDAVACLSMAVEMQYKMEKLREFWLNSGVSQAFQIRMGITTGYCTVGNFGSDNKLDYTIIGNNVNLASRLESSAKVNEILISEETYLLVRDKFNCIKKDKIYVKGFKESVQSYQVEGEYCKNMYRKSIDGFNLSIDFNTMHQNREVVIDTLKDIINKLDKK